MNLAHEIRKNGWTRDKGISVHKILKENKASRGSFPDLDLKESCLTDE